MRILAYTALLIAVGVCPAAAFDGPTQSTGGKKAAPAPGSAASPAAKDTAKPKTASPTEKLYNAGIKAYEAGNHVEAIKHLGAAIRAGGLQKSQVAKALYYRGLAFRKKGKPGQAISDLTSAYWLKEGLTPTERSDALSNRNAAYREAGISNAPAASESVVVAAEPSFSAWETATLGTAASPATNTSSVSQAPKAAVAPANNSSTNAAKTESSGGGFFSSITSLFTGGSSSSSASKPSEPKESVTTASIPAKPETSSWNQSTQVAAAPPAKLKKPAQVSTPFSTQVAAAPPPVKPKKPPQVTTPFATQVAAAPQSAVAAKPSKPKAASVPSGKYRLQVAAVRSRSEAEAVAASLMQKYGGKLGPRRPVVDEAVIGSMGTFYRVRVGPYANAKEPQQLCGTLRTSGFDCLVVTK